MHRAAGGVVLDRARPPGAAGVRRGLQRYHVESERRARVVGPAAADNVLAGGAKERSRCGLSRADVGRGAEDLIATDAVGAGWSLRTARAGGALRARRSLRALRPGRTSCASWALGPLGSGWAGRPRRAGLPLAV